MTMAPAEALAADITEALATYGPYKALAVFGAPPFRVNYARERLLGARVQGGQLLILIVRETRIETRTEVRTVARGVRIVSLSDDTGVWLVTGDTVTMASLPTPEVTYKYGTRRTAQEQRARDLWESDCYRPGNDTRLGGRDSFSRAVEGYTPDAQVKDVWGVTTYPRGTV